MFKKKCLFVGGVVLVNTIAMFASASASSNLFGTADKWTQTTKNKANQIYWRLHAHNAILQANGKFAWIQNPKYRDSIINVIGKAIGDCMVQENVFRPKESAAPRIILFKDQKYGEKYESIFDYFNYTASNWNALFLYNAVDSAINDKEYWENNDLTSENLIQICYKRIKDYLNDRLDLSDTERPEKQRTLTAQQEKITKYLEGKIQRTQALINKLGRDREKASATIVTKPGEYENLLNLETFYRQELNDIMQLQEALKNFYKCNDDMVVRYYYKEAQDKLKQAGRLKECKDDICYFETKAIDDYMLYDIDGYLLQKRKEIFRKKLPAQLEKAKSDMIKYCEALDLDKILEYYREYVDRRLGSPIKQNGDRIALGGTTYNIYQYDNAKMSKLEVSNSGNNIPITHKTEYSDLHFIIDRWGDIGITGIKKVINLDSDDSLNLNKKSKIEESFGYGRENEYSDLLKLLQGLVISMREQYYPHN